MELEGPLCGGILFALMLVLDIIFYGFGAALQALNKTQLEEKAGENDKKSRLLNQMVENPTAFVNTLHLMATVVNVGIGAYELHLFGSAMGSYLESNMGLENKTNTAAVSFLIVSFFCLLLILSIGITVPKKIAGKRAEKWAYKLVLPIRFFVQILFPFTYIVAKLSNLIIQLFGVDPHENQDDVTEEEILMMVQEGHEQGVLLASEAEMIHNIFELSDKEARSIMIHRKNILAIDGRTTLEEALQLMIEEHFSRYPVYEDTIDNIIGMIHVKDAMRCQGERNLRTRPLNEIPGLMMEPKFIPETRNINELFKTMQSQKIHMVMVVDEYGQTAGLVTMEDILEEIVGNILDEYDEEEVMIVKDEDGSYRIEGMASLEEVGEALGLDFGEEEVETMNGYLISRLDRIPKEGETPEIVIDGYLFKIESVENKMIQRVLVKKTEEIPENEEAEK